MPELKLEESMHVLAPGDQTVHAHNIITGRKSWKTLKGKSEAVWPPSLEQALFEGLAKYQPANPRATMKALGRYPNRNRYISEYIQRVTGKFRTPKQVGSRLQQLRDTCQGKELLHKLSNGGPDSRSSLEPADDENTPPASPIDSYPTAYNELAPRTVISIDILPQNHGQSSLAQYPYNTPSGSPTSASFPSPLGFSEPRPITVIDPTVAFTSSASMMAYSSFSVFLDGICVHSEVADLKLSTASCPVTTDSDVKCIFFYSTSLVPNYWSKLCECPDPTRYTITHDIVQHHDSSNPESSSSVVHGSILSIEYRFSYPDSPYPSPQLSPTDTLSSAGSNSTLPSPTTFNFDFSAGYPEPSLIPTSDFLTTSPSICYPDYSPATLPAAMSSEMDLALSPYVHFDSSLDSPMSIPVDPYLPHHYGS